MQEKDDSFNFSGISGQSDSHNVIALLSEKLPNVEDILTNALKIIEDEQLKEENEHSESKVDLISAFNEILEIYELTSIIRFNLRDRYLLVQQKRG